MSVERAMNEISSAEFVDWVAYDSIDPGNPEREDMRAALIACTIANVNRGKKGKAFKIQDFMLNFSPKERKTSNEIKTKLLFWKSCYEAKQKHDKSRHNRS